MKVRDFVDRPVLSSVISIFIVLLGIICLLALPIEKYPNIAPPSVDISATYTGASAENILKSVVMPIEEQVNGVEHMTYITSTSTNSGKVDIQVYFKQDADPDMATINVQNRVSQVMGELPEEVTRTGVTVEKRLPSILRIFSLYSPDKRYDQNFIGNYLHNNIKPDIQRIDGVGTVSVLSGKYSERIWLDPDKMLNYKLTPDDISEALQEQNVEIPVGVLGANNEQTFQYSLNYKGRKVTESDFSKIVIATTPDGGSLLLKDVARLELGMEEYTWKSNTNGYPGVTVLVYQVAGSNATKINEDIDAYFASLHLPEGLELITLENGNDFLFASLDNVEETLVIAIILVVLVCFFFLQDWRATVVPTVSILISLIGTFIFLAVMGWSMNLLTLFALVLVIGTVVDDSICVVEAVQERFDLGYKSSVSAAKDGITSIATALITTTMVFMLVFIPVSMMGGTTGIFYRQFGLSMAVAVGISALSAMTLAPALSSLIMKPIDLEHESWFMHWVRKIYNVTYTAMQAKYAKGLQVFINHKWLVAIGVVSGVTLLFILMSITPSGLVPEDDKGSIYIDITAPVGCSTDETYRLVCQVDSAVATIPEVRNRIAVAGQGHISGAGVNYALLVAKLKPWDERTEKGSDVNSVIEKIYAATRDLPVTIFAMSPPMIDGYGTGNNLEMWLINTNGEGNIKEQYKITQDFIKNLTDRPEISAAYCAFGVDYPQYMIDIDVEKCKRQGVSPQTVLNTLGSYCGGTYINSFNRFSKLYRVMIQGEPARTSNMEDLSKLYVRMDDGEMAPLGQFLTINKIYDPMVLKRFNLYNAIDISGMPADGYSTGEAINAIREVEATLPDGYQIAFSGMTREEEQTGGGNLGLVFSVCFVFIFLVLAALYESFLIPFSILLSVPIGLMGAFLFTLLFGLHNDIYMQVGLVMLIGLLAKTAILLTEFSSQCRTAGMTLNQAAHFAAKVRLRPVLMTVLTMVFGMLPMMASTGSGANGNRTIGSGTVGGMIFGTLSLLFFVPTMYIVCQWLQEKLKPLKFVPTEDKLIQEEIDRLVAAGELELPEECKKK